jgi:protocatechuate 3,4-dioxygenase alpha subunit
VSIGVSWNAGSAPGGAVLRGCVRDGAGAFVTDALLEFWCRGVFARALTGDDGCYEVHLDDVPHVDVSIFARGLMQRLVTRIYLSDDEDDLDADVRGRLRAHRQAADHFLFDICLQGENETVFFSPWSS